MDTACGWVSTTRELALDGCASSKFEVVALQLRDHATHFKIRYPSSFLMTVVLLISRFADSAIFV